MVYKECIDPTPTRGKKSIKLSSLKKKRERFGFSVSSLVNGLHTMKGII